MYDPLMNSEAIGYDLSDYALLLFLTMLSAGAIRLLMDFFHTKEVVEQWEEE